MPSLSDQKLDGNFSQNRMREKSEGQIPACFDFEVMSCKALLSIFHQADTARQVRRQMSRVSSCPNTGAVSQDIAIEQYDVLQQGLGKAGSGGQLSPHLIKFGAKVGNCI